MSCHHHFPFTVLHYTLYIQCTFERERDTKVHCTITLVRALYREKMMESHAASRHSCRILVAEFYNQLEVILLQNYDYREPNSDT